VNLNIAAALEALYCYGDRVGMVRRWIVIWGNDIDIH